MTEFGKRMTVKGCSCPFLFLQEMEKQVRIIGKV